MGLETFWRDAVGVRTRITAAPRARQVEWYQLADGALELASEEPAFNQRFEELYGECRCTAPSRADAARVRCLIRTDPASTLTLVTFEDPEPLDAIAFALHVFAKRGYREQPSPIAGWRLLEGSGVMAFSEGDVLVERTAAWQRFVGNFAVNRVLRLQRETVFFHAAAVRLGTRGVLMLGPKGAGKTTLALALSAQGCGFLGDELVGVRLRTRELVAIRRAAFVKPGPAARAVHTALGTARGTATERFPDGSVRHRVVVNKLFGTPLADSASLAAIVWLRGFAATPRLTPLPPTRQRVAELSPLACSLWGVPAGRRVVELMRLVAETPCYALEAGDPDETADRVAGMLEDRWDYR